MDENATQSPVTANLRAAQAESGLSNEVLAQRAGVSLRLLQKWRAGDVEPRYEILMKLAAALDRDVAWFYSVPVEDRTAA